MGWKYNIGRLVEDSILYSQDLMPEHSSSGDSLYGVSIDLSCLPVKTLTPEDYKFKLRETEKEISYIKNKGEELQKSFNEEKDKRKSINNRKITSVQKEHNAAVNELSLIPDKIKNLETNLKQVIVEEERLREESNSKLNVQYKEQVLKREDEMAICQEKKQKLQKDKDKLEDFLKSLAKRHKSGY